MNGAQREAVEALRAMMPGAAFRPDPYTIDGEDALLGDGQLLLHVERRREGADSPVGHVILNRSGVLLDASMRRS